jgi:hypothetical protein
MTSRLWYALAVALLVVGLAGAGWTMWSGLSGIGDTMERFVIPGSGEVTLAEPGTYTIFHETESVIGDRVYNVPSISNLTVGVTEEATGATVPVSAPGVHSTYTMGGHSGVSVLAFNAARPGRYRLTAAYGSGAGAPQTVLSVDRGFFGRLFRTILGTLAFAALAGIAAPAIGFTTYFRRRRMLRAAQMSGARLP